MEKNPPNNLFISGILPPVITPFKQSDEIDYDAFVRNIGLWNKTQLSGFLVLGSNSETPFLNEEEKLNLIELAVHSAVKDKFILAGTGLESTRETIALTNKAARLGAHAALLLTPHYYSEQMNTRALIHHYTTIAEASDIPILIYNVPKFTHLNISVEAVKILSQHPNIIGMKDSAGDLAQLEAFKNVVPPDFNLIVGSAAILYPAFQLGIRSAILAPANCLPNECANVQLLLNEGKSQQALELQARLIPVNKAVTDTYGIAGLKYACSLFGYEGGSIRSPLLPIDDEQKISIRSILTKAGFLR
jgi:4-hydroxy-2-oxoglutarate aldolase